MANIAFSAKKTLDIAQVLYEKHKVISYPRTNSNYVTEQNIPEMHRSLDALRGTPYDDFCKEANKNFVNKNNKSICNPTKVEDHHAILPTHKKANGLSPDEQKIYDLIVRRFLSHFYPAAEYKVHTVMTEVEQGIFQNHGQTAARFGLEGHLCRSSQGNSQKDQRKRGGRGA